LGPRSKHRRAEALRFSFIRRGRTVCATGTKKDIYERICEATLESHPTVTMAVYKASNGPMWTRPASVFFELVEQEGTKVPRFAPI
jgi:hypothetical protein